MPNLPIIKAAAIRVLYALLFIYAGIAGTYAVVTSISSIIGNFNLRNQVQAPFQLYGNLLFSPSAVATPHSRVRSPRRHSYSSGPKTEREHAYCDDSS